MSIDALLARLEAQERIRRFTPRSRRRPRRRLYLGPQAKVDYDDDQSATNMLVGRGFITAALTRWTLGDRVYSHFLKRLEAPPPEIWEIRVTEPTVQARLIGRFACADTIVLTQFHTRGLLGDRGSRQWAAAMAACARSWTGLFGDVAPHGGTAIDHYVTENCDDIAI